MLHHINLCIFFITRILVCHYFIHESVDLPLSLSQPMLAGTSHIRLLKFILNKMQSNSRCLPQLPLPHFKSPGAIYGQWFPR